MIVGLKIKISEKVSKNMLHSGKIKRKKDKSYEGIQQEQHRKNTQLNATQ